LRRGHQPISDFPESFLAHFLSSKYNADALVILVTLRNDRNKLYITSRDTVTIVTNRKLTTAVYISTIILLGSVCVSACAVFVPVDEPAPTTEVSRTTTTTQTNVPDATTQRTTVTQTNGY
jgi:hypothetical protein